MMGRTKNDRLSEINDDLRHWRIGDFHRGGVAMITPEMIEAAAVAMCERTAFNDAEHFDNLELQYQNDWRKDARVALEAAEAVRPQPEPVAWRASSGVSLSPWAYSTNKKCLPNGAMPLYAEPPAQGEPVNSKLLDAARAVSENAEEGIGDDGFLCFFAPIDFLSALNTAIEESDEQQGADHAA